jgi:hypothetical protein
VRLHATLKYFSVICATCLFAGITGTANLVASAQTQESMSVFNGNNDGTLAWTSTAASARCGSPNPVSFTSYTLSNFTYSYSYPSPYYSGENISVTESLPGTAGYISGSPGGEECPPSGPEPVGGVPLKDSGSFYRIWFTPGATGSSSTATMESFNFGGIAPKYQIIGVIYAPPGPGGTNSLGSSYVDYTGTTGVGTNTSLSSSFQNSYNYSTSAGFLGVKLTGGASWTQETDDSNSISINQTTSLSEKYPGLEPAANISGLEHDNDIILVWINPALLCTDEEEWTTVSIPAQTQCLIYDPKGLPGDPDDPDMDVVQLPVGELNGDYSLQTLNSDTYNILQNHGITSADYSTILSADPYASCGSSISCVQDIGVNSTRFDSVPSAGITGFENNCTQEQYTVTSSETSTQGQGASQTYSVTNSLSGSESFLGTISEMLTSTQTWTNKWSELTTSMTGQTALLSVSEPCSGYSGPSQFAVYKDNIYGSYMLYPTQ